MTDPTGRTPGAWPRDRPIRWRAIPRVLAALVLTRVAMIAQLGLIVPLLGMSTATPESSLVRFAVALVWAGATLWTAWCWFRVRARAIAAPILVGSLIWLVSSVNVGNP